MSKTLLLIICDFLLLSMLALARFDTPDVEMARVNDQPTAAETEERELIELLEMSLQSETESRENLAENLAQTRTSLEEREQELRAREEALEAARREAEAIAREREREAQERARAQTERDRLAQESARIEAERQRLARDVEQTRSRLETADQERLQLSRTLGETQESASVTQERLRRAQEDLRRREEELAARAEELARLAEARELTERERERAERELEVARAERSLLVENLETERLERELIRREMERAVSQSERLTEGVSALAQSSEEIRQEMERSRPQTPSEIYSRFERNQVTVEITARTRGVFGGENERTFSLASTLVTDGRDAYLLLHSGDTPLNFSNNPDRLLGLNARVRMGQESFAVREIGFHSTDPRVLFIGVPSSLVQRTGMMPFILSTDADRFDDVVLVRGDGSNFGRTSSRRITASEKFLRVERPAFGERFAEFAASRSDVVFSRNGELIGLMVNSRHAVVAEAFVAAGRLRLGDGFDTTEASAIIERLRNRVGQLPPEVR